ncbi:jg22647 [Pararge aegeria aegeria]|uniref:Jg22647 protein n=1 Tax=Pararge aegeria aegeria TaxID=348720 RepID=A0A8S4RAM8_9NEOP|nr:jg22647 [Pararge aegeria aegeria]
MPPHTINTKYQYAFLPVYTPKSSDLVTSYVGTYTIPHHTIKQKRQYGVNMQISILQVSQHDPVEIINYSTSSHDAYAHPQWKADD